MDKELEGRVEGAEMALVVYEVASCPEPVSPRELIKRVGPDEYEMTLNAMCIKVKGDKVYNTDSGETILKMYTDKLKKLMDELKEVTHVLDF